MAAILKIAVLLAVVAAAFASEYPCIYFTFDETLYCGFQGLSLPPPGYWPQITELSLSVNKMTELPKNSLSGFPALKILDLSQNKLTELDLDELAAMTDLLQLDFAINEIHTISPPTDGIVLKDLAYIDASENRISYLDPDFFSFAPNLLYLDIRYNPLEVQPGQPLFTYLPKLEYLYAGLYGTSFGDVDSTFLSGLPNLRHLHFNYAGITSLEGAFVNNKFLEEIFLHGYYITQITAGTFPSEERIQYLSLDDNPLTRLDTAAVNKAMAPGGTISLRRTSLACDCSYEAVYWWAQAKKCSIFAYCKGQPACSFT